MIFVFVCVTFTVLNAIGDSKFVFVYQEINLDLVKFRSPVLIKEIRIIPLGAKVEADFPGGWRLG